MSKISKKYPPAKRNKQHLKFPLPEKIERYDFTIDLAEIKHLSRKMYETGKISRKTLKKWFKRDYTNTSKGYCGCKGSPHTKCVWLPNGVFNRYNRKHLCMSFNWTCIKCKSSTSWLYEEELSEPLQHGYPEHVHTHRFD